MAVGSDRESGLLEYPVNSPLWTVERRKAILERPFTHDRSEIELPPGLGFDIDQRALRRYGKRFLRHGRRRLIFHTVRDKGLRVAREIDRTRREHGGQKTEAP
jgi:hypothetical protein